MTEEEQKYLAWLHDLTTLGYTQEVELHYLDFDVVKDYYTNSKTPEEALKLYMELKNIKPLTDQ